MRHVLMDTRVTALRYRNGAEEALMREGFLCVQCAYYVRRQWLIQRRAWYSVRNRRFVFQERCSEHMRACRTSHITCKYPSYYKWVVRI